MARVSLRGLAKAYEAGAATIRDLDLEIRDEEFVVLVGPSGCGKSTTLRMIAGFEDPSAGEIWIDGTRVDGLDPRDRDIAMVFQNYALYPHMTVAENMGFGLKMRQIPKVEIRQRVLKAAEILGITTLLDRHPKTLSGGQRQRVAMGRAIVRAPKLFLFDEPLSNLDAKLRGHMRTEIKRLQRSLKTTTIYVTHDQVEAMTLADRIVVLNNGSIEQIGSPQDLYARPATRFVASFIGSPTMNFVACTVSEEQFIILDDGSRLPVPGEWTAKYAPHIGRKMVIGIRPEHLNAGGTHTGENAAQLNVRVDLNEPLGAETLVHFKIGEAVCCASVDPTAAVAEGAVMPFSVAMDKIHLIDPTTDRVV